MLVSLTYKQFPRIRLALQGAYGIHMLVLLTILSNLSIPEEEKEEEKEWSGVPNKMLALA